MDYYIIVILVPVSIFVILTIIKKIYKHKNPSQEPINNGLSMITKAAGTLVLGVILIVILLIGLGIWGLSTLGPIGLTPCSTICYT